jgi:N6-adenosine-specific RNA methylase IME4
MKRYRTLVIDPPWPLELRGKRSFRHTKTDAWRGHETISLPYPTLTLEQIKSLPIRSLLERDAHVYLWTINHFLAQSYEVAHAWRLRPVQLLTWCKRPMGLGLGGTYANTTEHILFCKRGHLKPLRRIDTSWWLWKRQHRHSQKPEEFQTLVESVSPGPYLELFARRKRPGWSVWGDEVASDISLEIPPNTQPGQAEGGYLL